ncbi:tetratricopeptide repeat-containing sensor histidine kinase [Lutibacter flavus]|uniref:histidine kinase n=1 Tax=Lutibacter flavus TaxID=691689 RepID=A0A238X583_9FLAO|nr:tetratricopeptide repeat-containing sensor histidine kinase [Lutibacter flavus]SNR54156.1 Signal transduction histidine kinase [Lutibacter flavus]
MTKYIYFIFLLISVNIVYCQGYKDIELNKLNTSKNDTLKIQVLIDKGDEYYRTYPDTAYTFYKQALDLSKETNSIKNEATCLLRIGNFLNYKEEYKNSLEYYLKSIELYRSIDDDRGVADAYYYIGESFSYLSSYDKSFEYYFKSLDIYKKINEKYGEADVYIQFGNAYYNQNAYEKAEVYFLKAHEIYCDLDSKEGLATSSINMGNVIADQGRIDEGMVYYLKSIELCEELNDFEGIAINYTNIGDCYFVSGEYEKALEYFNKSIELSKRFQYKSLDPLNYANIAVTYLQLKKYRKAILYSNKSLESSKHVSWKYKEYNNHDYLSTAYEALEDYKSAYKNQKIFRKYTDSIATIKEVEELDKLEVLYELENQEKQIGLLTKNEEARKLELINQKKLNTFLVVLSLLFLILTFLLVRQRKERKKAYSLLAIEKEKVEESDHLKSAFLANMSHEIRTPMNAIMGFSSFLKNPDLEPVKRDRFVDIINNSGERLMTIINDIIDISKIESNQLKVDVQEVNVKSTLKEIIEIQKNSNIDLIKKDIKLSLAVPLYQEDLIIKTDQNRFIQIINNLVNNAIKFTDEGFVEVGCKILKINNKPHVEFYVKDTGCGISKNKFEIIFDRFSQAGENNFKEGNGLGLSICKGLVTLLGGKIWLESEKGVGTTFYFNLPY